MVEPIRYTNLVLSYPTQVFLDVLATAGQTFEDTAADRQAATDNHNQRETALYAVSIQRNALTRT